MCILCVLFFKNKQCHSKELNFHSLIAKDYSIKIYSFDGKLMSPSNYKLNNNHLDISLLSIGIFIIEVNMGNKLITKKVIKQ